MCFKKLLVVCAALLVLMGWGCKKHSGSSVSKDGQESSAKSGPTTGSPIKLPPKNVFRLPVSKRTPYEGNQGPSNGSGGNGGGYNGPARKNGIHGPDAVVPEPGTLLLVGIGLAMAGFVVGKRKP